jgi:hypothetical protein
MAAISSLKAVAMTAWLAREVQRTISAGRAVPAGLSGGEPNKAARQDLADLGNPLFRRALKVRPVRRMAFRLGFCGAGRHAASHEHAAESGARRPDRRVAVSPSAAPRPMAAPTATAGS